MGLFDFAKNIGRKLFDREEDAGDKIQSHIEDNNPGVENLKVEVKDGVATLSGEAESAEALEKAILMAGNVDGVSEVKVDGVDAPAVEESEDAYYEIQSGDTLWAIASKHLGDGNRYPEIFEANREVIQDPDLIFPGQKIRIPKATEDSEAETA